MSTHQIPERPIADPAAWTAAELGRDESWIRRLNPHHLVELKTATKKVRDRGLALYGFGREDFELPTVAPIIAECADGLENGHGCAVIRGIDVRDYDIDEIKLLYWGVACHFGIPMSQNAHGHLIGHVRDQGGDYYSKNTRGYTTKARLRPHCDATDAVGLLCWRTAKSGGESLMSSSISIFNEILATHLEYLPTLFRGFHFDLRGDGITDDPNETTFNRVPIFSWYAGRLSCRFNQKSIEEGMIKRGEPLSEFDQAAVDLVGRLALDDRFRFDLTFEPGDIQVLSNHMVLHSRTAFEDWPEEDRKRNLMRLWLNLRESRELAPEFADRLNTGPRGGVMVREQAAE